MPRKDTFHQTVKEALEKDNWVITHDPLFVPTEGGNNFFIDLGSEKIVGIKKEGRQIAVEIKSFDENNPMYDFYEILGQFLIYNIALSEQFLHWELFIAMSKTGYYKLKEAPIFNKAMQQFNMQFIIIDKVSKTIIEWKK